MCLAQGHNTVTPVRPRTLSPSEETFGLSKLQIRDREKEEIVMKYTIIALYLKTQQ